VKKKTKKLCDETRELNTRKLMKSDTQIREKRRKGNRGGKINDTLIVTIKSYNSD